MIKAEFKTNTNKTLPTFRRIIFYVSKVAHWTTDIQTVEPFIITNAREENYCF